MGATGSRSSPPTETLLVTIYGYSKLMRAPDPRRKTLDMIRFRDLWWDVTVTPMRLNKETGVSESDFLILGVHIAIGLSNRLELALGTDISIEILDETGEGTVFHCESSRCKTQKAYGSLLLGVWRSELESSSCVRRRDDSFLVRCTLKEQPRPGLLGNWFSSKSEVLGKVDMARCHMLTVRSLSEIKAALLSRQECVHSTRFDVGGSRWYLTLCPTLAAVRLVRATKDDDETRTTAEFSFALEGAVNVQSEKMTHTFDRDNPDCAFVYQPPEEEPRPSTTSTDRLVVRCCVKVIPPVAPTAVPSPLPAVTIQAADPRAAAISTTVPTPTESELTPLLSAMHG